MSHHELSQLLPWFINGRLSEQDRARVSAHVKVCPICTEEVAALRALAFSMTASAEEDSAASALIAKEAVAAARSGLWDAETNPERATIKEPPWWVRLLRGPVFFPALSFALLMVILFQNRNPTPASAESEVAFFELLPLDGQLRGPDGAEVVRFPISEGDDRIMFLLLNPDHEGRYDELTAVFLQQGESRPRHTIQFKARPDFGLRFIHAGRVGHYRLEIYGHDVAPSNLLATYEFELTSGGIQ